MEVDKPAADSGFENAIEFVSGPDGPHVYKRFRRADRFEVEIEAIRLASQLGISPPIVSIDRDNLLIVRAWCPGHPLDFRALSPKRLITRVETLARCLRVLHGCTSLRWGAVCGSPQDSWKRYLEDRLALRLEQATSLPLDAKAWVARWALQHLDRLRIPRRASLLHHDLKPANILYHNRQIQLIDFEQAKWGDPLSDLAKLKWRTLYLDPGLWQSFAKAYLQGPITPDLDRTVDFYLAMHCLGSLAYDGVYSHTNFKQHAASAQAFLQATRDLAE